ncbi:D-alanyl-D-alanine carboxypeptidase/D-alanyl-D-alanine-endopeptidase [Stagnimonas aquatica]|uniref:D-alanyl-D-alanine carboxypeptidase/D-alanyl-D-alanine-endopeptidase n=1 Tax=Stagnimonas aquatica TaxID=2689987 RepID=A0A3N0VDZ9_9GAMM|nr:D-alanyl-D-alanine carboxypeptidase/D-alanyl-D-alanine-endopeptidase [Stagnimonas aquatica]
MPSFHRFLPRLPVLLLAGLAFGPGLAHADLPALSKLQSQGGKVSALVVDLDRNEAIAALNADSRLSPASVTKLVTAGAALDAWPADRSFTTRLLSERGPREGAIEGALTLHGEGDSTLDHQALFSLAVQLRSADVTAVNGGITVSTAPFGPLGCETKDRCDALVKSATAYNAPLAALGVDYGNWCIEVRPQRVGTPAQITACGGVQLPIAVEGSVMVVPSGRRQTFYLDRFTNSGGDFLRVGGELPMGGMQTLYRAMSEPSLGTGLLLRETLRSVGIRVDGAVSVSPEWPSNGATELARVEGAALKEQLARMLRHSNNYVADLITLNVAVAIGRKPGPLADAAQSLSDYVARAQPGKKNDARPVLFSGSGLTPENRLSAQDLVSVLEHQYRDTRRFPAFYGGLVVPREGPYAFLRRGGSPAWLDRVALKTGTLSEPISVNAMAGYLRKKNGGWMAFAVIVNGAPPRRVIPFGTAVEAIRTDIEQILARY